MCVGKLKRDKRRKRKGNNPFGRKGKVGAQQTDSTERTSIQTPSSTDRIVPSGSGAQGSGAPTKKNATKPPPSARAIKVLLAYLQIDFIDLLEKFSLSI